MAQLHFTTFSFLKFGPDHMTTPLPRKPTTLNLKNYCPQECGLEKIELADLLKN